MSKMPNCVLLVDDDDICNFLTKALVDQLGVAKEVFTTINGRQALDLVQEKIIKEIKSGSDFHPVLILLDINMPVMDGFEFLEAFNDLEEEVKQKIHVVMLSSSENEEDLKRAHSLGVKGFITKPLNNEKLQEAMSAVA